VGFSLGLSGKFLLLSKLLRLRTDSSNPELFNGIFGKRRHIVRHLSDLETLWRNAFVDDWFRPESFAEVGTT